MKIDEIPSDARDVMSNWKGVLDAIVDSYDRKRGVPHGVQKDGIQNSWDARLNKDGTDWKFTVSFIQGQKHSYFVLEDEGTHGLTGRVRATAEELFADLPEYERWIRFENFAFSKQVTDANMPLGSRGRGKFIFLGSSKRNTILYDSLRKDQSYRFGLLRINGTSAKTYSWDDELGRQELADRTNGEITPLKHAGTRIIIVNPTNELLRDYKSGKFLDDIEETWWQIIKEQQANIRFRNGHDQVQAKVPWYYDLPDEDSDTIKVWIKTPRRLPGIQVKRLHIASFQDKIIDPEIRGVAIQRGHMKICSIDPRRLPDEIASTLCGYIEFEMPTELKLRAQEGEDHYSLNFRKATARAVKNYVEEECMKFAVAKLGYHIDAQVVQERQQRTTETIALQALNRMARNLKMKAISIHQKATKDTSTPVNPLRVWMPDLEFPTPQSRRVDTDETLKIPDLQVINDSDKRIKGKLRLIIRSMDAENPVEEKVYTQPIDLDSHSVFRVPKPIEMEMDSERFSEKGRYMVVAELDTEDGDEVKAVDTTRKSFYLKQNPPATGLFEKFEAVTYPEAYKKILGEAIIGESGGYILRYNVGHPAWQEVIEDSHRILDYLTELGFHEICRIDTSREKPQLYTLEDFENPDQLLHKTLDIVGRFMYDLHAPDTEE